MTDQQLITGLLHRWSGGDQDALSELTPLVYEQLRSLAESAFRNEHGVQTLQPTAIVNEAYLQLAGAAPELENRAHFYALSARMMRRILVNHAHARRAAKRGGGQVMVTYQEGFVEGKARDDNVLDLDEALNALARVDEELHSIVELHYFAGMTYKEVGAVLGISEATTKRRLRFAKAWVRKFMYHSDDSSSA